jgi:ribosome-binding protein aMBF1 (putative translation factor)
VKSLKNREITTLDDFIDTHYDAPGTGTHDAFEKGYADFRVGAMLQQARQARGLTQEQLAQKAGTNKGYISKVENDIKSVRVSTLQRIVESGLGGRLELAIRF